MKHGVIALVLLGLGGCVRGGEAGGDAGVPDDTSSDADTDSAAAPADAAVADADPTGPTSVDANPDPTLLSQQGVYGDFSMRTIPSDAITFAPRWELWSDGASKRRWLILPPGGQIDNTNPEHWRLPVGTRAVKEFTRNGVVVETRVVETTASGPVLRTYVWNTAQTDAVLDTDGATNVAGTTHDVPTTLECTKCHRSETGGALGISAVQLSPAQLAVWNAAGMFVVPLASTTFGPTGTPAQVAAVGYLHANCGHCHNPGGYAAETNNMSLRLDAAAKAATDEPAYTTTVNVTVQGNGAGAGKRVAPGNANGSAIVRRMSVRGNYDQMPLLGSEVVDNAGVATVTAWIDSM